MKYNDIVHTERNADQPPEPPEGFPGIPQDLLDWLKGRFVDGVYPEPDWPDRKIWTVHGYREMVLLLDHWQELLENS